MHHIISESIITLVLLALAIAYVNRNGKPKSKPIPSDWKHEL